ncbi:hypothetical protein [Mechercharimyces sp. CAU 1602]|uniref:hypothetical protein n=1 Tax=Mechercharimyces sp. CAU 1602 TaxID=2973933 RepID=UPI0021615700|nr:hypothetical protein [Mechercharimyces sp. CAU 1602]MCS1350054.1 hypothetical protein [Mechercharimyces sp. CAU 1602]
MAVNTIWRRGHSEADAFFFDHAKREPEVSNEERSWGEGWSSAYKDSRLVMPPPFSDGGVF